MAKTNLVINNDYNDSVAIGIIAGYSNGQHTHKYQVFDLANSIANAGIIGVNDKETFAVQFKFSTPGDYAVALFLDGVNVAQQNGIQSLNEIPENQRSNYKAHKSLFIAKITDKGRSTVVDRYSQKNGENRLFTFTTSANSGVNEILINDASLTNRIDIYVWGEEAYDDMIDNNHIFESRRTKIGAGEATHQEYKKARGLDNPFFLGKVMFIHTHADNVKQLGKALLSIEELNDPMNKVPIS